MENEIIKGFKVFNPDWTCRNFQYEVGQTYEMDCEPDVCNRGFHFCEKASDCFEYYKFDSANKVAEIEALGAVDSDGKKSCTNKIRIVREVPWDEVLRIVNEGKDCTGRCNTGNRNTGDWNTGDCNTGDCNTGNRNTGDWNTGDWNTGDWNKSSFNNGCFMTIEPKIMMFNKPSEWTYRDWLNSEARYLLNQIQKNVLEWIWSSDMTDAEKEAHPEHEITGGYLKKLDESACGQLWWDSLNEKQKNIIRNLPNFDSGIFEEITGIKTE